MAKPLTDREIAALLADKKSVTARQRDILYSPKTKKHRPDLSSRIRIKSKSDKRYSIRVRQSAEDPQDFSVILSYHTTGTKPIRLIRCNGLHAPHTNELEKRSGTGVMTIPAKTFHIHQITERYQQSGKPDQYAEPTDKYHSFKSAVEFMTFSFGCFDPSEVYSTRYPLLND